jgi:hypothetical protein
MACLLAERAGGVEQGRERMVDFHTVQVCHPRIAGAIIASTVQPILHWHWSNPYGAMVGVVGVVGVVVWWCGGVVVWWCGGVVVWWCGGQHCIRTLVQTIRSSWCLRRSATPTVRPMYVQQG